VLVYLGLLKSFFLSSSCLAVSDFRYYYFSASLYVFAISVVISKNDLENKIIHVLSLSNTLCTILFSYYHLNYLKILSYTIC
jgi:hypothetical protein